MQAAAHTGIVSERLPFNYHFAFWEEKQAQKLLKRQLDSAAAAAKSLQSCPTL